MTRELCCDYHAAGGHRYGCGGPWGVRHMRLTWRGLRAYVLRLGIDSVRP
jgi:hypothetical protein